MTVRHRDIPIAILAGGLATRLRPITEKIPKSLMPVAGKPFLAHQLELLHAHGIRRAVLCIGYLGEMIQRDFGNEAFGVKLDYSFRRPKIARHWRRDQTQACRSLAKNFLCSTAIRICRLNTRQSRNFFSAAASPA
jgi:UTP-glucose-1-phosphate uridylyltransferase